MDLRPEFNLRTTSYYNNLSSLPQLPQLQNGVMITRHLLNLYETQREVRTLKTLYKESGTDSRLPMFS